MPIGITLSAVEGGICYDDQNIFHNHRCSCPRAWGRFCTSSGTGSRQLWNGNIGFNRAYGAIIRCSTVGIGSNFLVLPGRFTGIRARRVYRYHCRQHRWVDCSCYGDHSRYAEFNGMGCCSNLSLRSSGVRLLRDGAIISAIVALKFKYSCPSSAIQSATANGSTDAGPNTRSTDCPTGSISVCHEAILPPLSQCRILLHPIFWSIA
jgi:hypothetical protein